MKKFETPEIQIIKFNCGDVIATSTPAFAAVRDAKSTVTSTPEEIE